MDFVSPVTFSDGWLSTMPSKRIPIESESVALTLAATALVLSILLIKARKRVKKEEIEGIWVHPKPIYSFT